MALMSVQPRYECVCKLITRYFTYPRAIDAVLNENCTLNSVGVGIYAYFMWLTLIFGE
jgi:hypothetical protein